MFTFPLFALTVDNADDLCYEDITSSGWICMNMGMCSGGINCKNTIPLKNIGDSSLNQVRVFYDENGGVGGSYGSDCGVNPDGNCSTTERWFMSGKATEFNITNPIPIGDNSNSIWAKEFASGQCFGQKTLWATYVKNEDTYQGEIKACGENTNLNIDSNCGAFPTALNTMQTLNIVDNNGNPANNNQNNVVHNDDGVSAFSINPTNLNTTNDNLSCEDASGDICIINPPPEPSLFITFQETSKTDSCELRGTENDEEYGDIIIRSNVDFVAPSSSDYIMKLGDLEVNTNDITLTFTSGYYFIKSLNTSENNFKIDIDASHGPVWLIFSEDGATFDSNGIEINYNQNVGNLLIYSAGDISLPKTGGSKYSINAYIYTKGNFEILGNANSGYGLTGAVTAEGNITLAKHKDIYFDPSGLENFGLQDCLITQDKIVSSFDAWDIDKSINDRNIATKILKDDFNLSINQLNSAKTAIESDSTKWQTIDFWLYDNVANTKIENTTREFTTKPTQIISFNIDKLYKDVSVAFKICASYDGTNYSLSAYENCEESTNYEHQCLVDANTTYNCFRTVYSSDNFAIRPNKFNILGSNDAHKMRLNSTNQLIFQTLSDSETTQDYNETNSFKIDAKISDSSKNCVHNVVDIDFAFVNGEHNLTLDNFDVGDFNISISEINGQEFAKVDADDTPNADRFITPFSKTFTLIPNSFSIVPTFTNANSDNNFTYISDNLNQSATLNLIITPKDANNVTTQNYTKECYAKDFNLSINYEPFNTLLTKVKSKINTFSDTIETDINKTISFDANKTLFDTNAIADFNLSINFNREKNNSINPFIFTLKDINITDEDNASSTISTNQDATFVYGRTHSSRQTFVGNTGSSNIYFEVYCNSSDCNKTLLQNKTSPNLKHTNDMRWFINENHSIPNDGTIGIVTQKYGNGINITTQDANPSTATFKYEEKYGYPYKTTIQNSASSWLIYNPDDATSTKNSFQVEFIKIGEWTGEKETDTTTKNIGSAKINRRTIW